jgi:RNA polymerase sigma-70 factor (ECF subfamily)
MKPRELEAQLERLHPESFGWALSCCGHDETEAEDVLQNTYLKIVSGKARFEGRSSLKTWVFGVIRRTAQEASRRTTTERDRIVRLVPDELEDPSLSGPDRELIREENARRLVDAMKALSERQREILHLVFYQEMTISEAADVMGVSLGSARTHYERGKERLRAVLKEGENVA